MKKKSLYDMNYIRANYHRIDLKVPFDDYEKWKAAAEAEGLPVATWIKDKCNKAAKGADNV